MFSWKSNDELLGGASVAVGASETDTPVSEVFFVEDPNSMLVELTCSGVTVTTGITAKLQESMDKTNWSDKSATGQVAISANGRFFIRLSAYNDSNSDMPLADALRVVVSSGAGDAVTVDSVKVAKFK